MPIRLTSKPALAAILSLTMVLATSVGEACAGHRQKIRIGTFAIPLMVVDQDNGVFVELTEEILDRADIEADIIVMPPKRALLYFSTKDIDVIFPALDVYFTTGSNYTKPSEIFYVKEDFVFTRKGDPLLRIIPELEEKYVGITRGYPYVPELTGNRFIKLEHANTDEQNAIKLSSGRLDAFVAEEFSGLKAFRNTGLEGKVQYDPETPLSRQDVFYAFQGTQAGQFLSDQFSAALRSMKDDGTFDKIMAKAKPQQVSN